MSQIKTIQITGMHCDACEKLISKRLERIEGVQEAIVSKEDKTATITADRSIELDEIKTVLDGTDYQVTNLN